MEELNISVEKVTLGDMDVFEAELMDELEDAGRDSCFANGGDIGIRADRGFVFEDNAVKFRDV